MYENLIEKVFWKTTIRILNSIALFFIVIFVIFASRLYLHIFFILKETILILPSTVFVHLIIDFTILPKNTSGQDLRLSGQRLCNSLLAVDPYGAVILFVHDGFNWTFASAIQLEIIMFHCEINNNLPHCFLLQNRRRQLTVDTNEWLGSKIVSAAGVRTILFLSCQRGLCDWRDVTCGSGVYRRRQVCSCRCYVRFPGTASSIIIICRLKDIGTFWYIIYELLIN